MKASLIIPTYNACERLFYSLSVLNQQDYPRNMFEVILINNGCSDNTEQMLSSFKPNYKLTVIKLPNVMSRAYARNKGILEAKNELIIFHDSDMLAYKDYIRKHVETHVSDKTVACGRLWSKIFTYYYTDFNNAQKDSFKKHMNRYIQSKNIKPLVNKKAIIRKEQITSGNYINYHFDVELYYNQLLEKHGRNLDGFNFEWLFFVTRNCSVRKSSILEAGLFDESFDGWGSEDTDLGFRLYQKGHKLIVNPDIISIHQEHPKSLSDIESAEINRTLLIKKHDSIDLLLFFLYRHFGLNAKELNDAMSDIKIIRTKLEDNILISLFQSGLVDLRNKLYNNSSPQIPSNFNIDFVVKNCSILIKDFNAAHFVKALIMLFKEIYDITIII